MRSVTNFLCAGHRNTMSTHVENVEDVEDDTILSSSPPNPDRAKWLTIGHGKTDITEEDFKIICDYFKSKSRAGAICVERGDKLKHAHCHVGVIMDLPNQWRRDLFHKLGWEGKRESKWIQSKKCTWTPDYTWQNIVGGYMAKANPKLSSIWGINPQYLLKGKVTYTQKLDAQQDKLELNPSNIVRILCAVGRNIKAKTAREALQGCLDKGYGTWKLYGKLQWGGIEADYRLKVLKEKPNVHELITEFQRH